MRRHTAMAREAVAQATPSELGAMERAVLGSFFDSLDDLVDQVGLPAAGGPAARAPEDGAAGSESAPRAWQPVEITRRQVTAARAGEVKIENSYTISVPQAIVWGVMGAAAAFGISLVTERSRGTLLRLRAAPISRTHVLAGKALACFITITCVVGLLLLVAIAAFGVRPGWAALPLLLMAILSIGIAFVGIMMLLSVLGRTEAAASGIGWAVLIVMAMLGGGMIPLLFLKGWMRTMSHFSPVKWAIYSLEGALWRGFGFEQMLLPCAILVGVGVATFTVGAGVFGRRGD
jgi:ABC-2 type transport system permease protein